MNGRTYVRTAFGLTVVLAATVLLAGYVGQTALGPDDGELDRADTATVTVNSSAVAPSELTVVSVPRSPTVGAKLMAFGPNGTRRYYDDTLDYYSDVDPSPRGEYTVTYVGAQSFGAKQCDGATPCRRMVIERANLSTGEVTRLYSRVVPSYQSKRHHYSNRWHDVDRINATHFAVADIERDRVFVVNTSSEIITWTWQALARFPVESGGTYPYDFTHLNDVEVLDDGRVMVSVRNQDRVVFINRTTGVVTDWTLGGTGSQDVLNGQHNPDFIPKSQGGPAVVVADSLNDRIVEFQRGTSSEQTNGSRASSGGPSDGAWKRTWTWKDARLQWPRDADRLPNGHTLVTDSHGDRVFEVNQQGEIVWGVSVEFPYEAERLGTGDESAGGPSATKAGLQSRSESDDGGGSDSGKANGRGTADDGGLLVQSFEAGREILDEVEEAVPERVMNGVLFMLPGWMGVGDAFALLIVLGVVGTWLIAEAYWRGYRPRLPVTRRTE